MPVSLPSSYLPVNIPDHNQRNLQETIFSSTYMIQQNASEWKPNKASFMQSMAVWNIDNKYKL